MSFFLTPLLTLPIVLRSKKIAKGGDKTSGQESPPQQKTADSPSEVKTEGEVKEEPEANKYGYKEGGKVISDSFILSESNDKAFLGKKVPQERMHNPPVACVEFTQLSLKFEILFLPSCEIYT